MCGVRGHLSIVLLAITHALPLTYPRPCHLLLGAPSFKDVVHPPGFLKCVEQCLRSPKAVSRSLQVLRAWTTLLEVLWRASLP